MPLIGQQSRTAIAAIATAWMLHAGASPAAAAATGAGMRIDLPFNPVQCERALGFARQLRAERDDGPARALLAQAYACRGIAHDDPWALEAALELFRRIAAGSASDPFVLADYADALCVRYPASEEAEQALGAALAAITPAASGAAAGDLRMRLGANLVEVRRRRAELDAMFAGAHTGPAVESASPLDAVRRAEAGPAAAERVLIELQAREAAGEASPAAMLVGADLLRGRRPRRVVGEAYAAIQQRLCDPSRRGFGQEMLAQCALVRQRLDQLTAEIAASGLE